MGNVSIQCNARVPFGIIITDTKGAVLLLIFINKFVLVLYCSFSIILLGTSDRMKAAAEPEEWSKLCFDMGNFITSYKGTVYKFCMQKLCKMYTTDICNIYKVCIQNVYRISTNFCVHHLESIAEWLKANKISLNSGKTELVLDLKTKKLPKTWTLE